MNNSANKTVTKAMILTTVIIMDLLAGMEFDLFVPSFAELQSHFHLSPFWVEALLSFNFAGYCLSLFFVGALADRYGRKPIILLGMLTFIVGSLMCLYLPLYHFLLAGRFLQGLGIAAPAILSFLIIADTYPLKEQPFLMAMLNGSMNAAAGIAPVIGSYITLYFHWQGNFMALLLLGLVALVMTLLFIPYSPQKAQLTTLSWRGYLPIFKSKPLLLIIVTILFNFVPYWIFVGMSPLLYIKDLGVSLAHFGFYQGSLAFIFAIGCLLYGYIIKHWIFSHKNLLTISLLIFIAGLISIVLVSITNSQSPLLITLAMLIFVIGQIIPGTILTPLSFHLMPNAKGRISAITQGGRLIFAAIGLQSASLFYQGSFQNIGLIISVFVTLTIIGLFFIIKNRDLMTLSES